MKIFWRIFLAFWLSTSAIMLLTAYVVVHKIESNRALHDHLATAEATAKQLIELHEQDRRLPRRLHRFMESAHKMKSAYPVPLSLVIFDHAQQEIYRSAGVPKKRNALLEFNVTGNNGEHYRVLANKPILPHLLRFLFARVFSIQLLVVLLVTAVVSALLSHYLVRPLQLLGQYSKQFARREVTEVPAAVLARSDELGDLARELAAMSHQVTELINKQQQLFHDVSHELRAPLARIQARVALLEQAGVSTSTTEALHLDCEKIHLLIQRALDYARLNHDSETLVTTDLTALLHLVINGVTVEFPARQLLIDSPTEFISKVYPEALSSALENIVRNACLYTPEHTLIEITLAETIASIIIRVRDHGDGIDEAEQTKLLEPFYRSGGRMHGEGFGLGLSIAQRAIAKHGGTIELTNADGGGLSVVIQFDKTR